MQFYKRPFLYITPLLIVGTLIGTIVSDFEVVLVATISSLILMVLAYFYFHRIAFMSLSFISIIALGGLVGVLSNHKSNSSIDLTGNKTFIAQVVEFQEGSKNWNKAIVRVTAVKNGDALEECNSNVLLYFNSDVIVNDVLMIRTSLSQIANRGNPGEFDAETFWASKGIERIGFVSENEFEKVDFTQTNSFLSFIQSTRSKLSRHIDNYFSGESKGIVKAILLGDKSSLSMESKNAFSKAGAMHVLAVSGLHVGIVMYLLMFLLGRFHNVLSKRSALVITVLMVWFYALLTGMSPSVMRAALMFSILLSGQILSKKNNSINTLFLSAFILLVLDGNLLFDIGFQLSYLAVLGILLLHKPIVNLIYIPNKWLLKLWEGTVVGIAAQIFTFPLSLYYFHQFPNYFVLTNLVVMILAGVILTIGLLFLLSRSVIWIASSLAILLALIVNAFLFFIQFVSTIPGSVATGFEISPIVVMLLYSCIALLVITKLKRVKIVVSVCLLVIITSVQVDRYYHLSEDHIVLFNDSKPLIAVKVDNQIICLHSKSQEKIKHTIENYQKIYPGNIKYIPLQKDKGSIIEYSDERVVIKPRGKNIEINVGEKEVLVRTDFEIHNNVDVSVALPYLQPIENEISLKEGAFVVEL